MNQPYRTKEEIYRIIDSFLVEAKDQHGNDRSLERLNQDRHLAAEQIENLIHDIRKQDRKVIKEWIHKKSLREQGLRVQDIDEYLEGLESTHK